MAWLVQRLLATPVSRAAAALCALTVLAGLPLGVAAASPERIVSLAPSVTETLFALNAEDRLIARTRYCKQPKAAEKIPVVGGMTDPDVEALMALKPDLILASSSTPEVALKQMRRVKLHAEALESEGLDGVFENIATAGDLIGALPAAEELNKSLRARIEAIEKKLRAAPPGKAPRTIIFYGAKTHFCAGPGSFSGEILERAGGSNVAQEANEPWPRMSRERIFAWNPEVIVLSLSHSGGDVIEARKLVEQWNNDPLWKRVDAIKNNRVHLVTGSLLTVPGPRIAEATEAIAALLYPQLFPELKSKDVQPAIQP